MRCVQFVASRTETRSKRVIALLPALVTGIAIWLIGSSSAHAIPSPELVVGSLSSISQLIALASALLGGGALAVGARAARRGGQQASPWPMRFALGFATVFMVSVGVNIWQYMSYSDSVRERLEATLNRPTPRAAGGRTLDPTLKEVSYADQLKHPRGIDTGDLETILKAKERGEHPNMFMMDIRETAESEMGTMPGAQIVRFPDISSANIDFKGKTAILFCHNGNRGYETCEALSKMGIDCKFLVGGLEKWLVEQRTLTGFNARTLSDLRALKPFRNQATLLDTPEVKNLVETENALFVDVRYPGEFASGALPNAVNLPIRPTPTPQLKQKISELPKRPIIVPCYDRRSCFFGEVLGLELDRAGYDFRGRYTVPWEYFIASTPRPYIQQWLDQAGKSYWTKAGEALASVVGRVADHTGLILAIMLLALVSRILVLPFSMKAERDQMAARRTQAEFDDIKERFKNDPPRRTRAIKAYYARHGMTPMRNLIALLFLPVMALALVAVQEVSTKAGQSLLWIPNLAERDELLILPVLFGVFITLYIEFAFVSTLKQRIWVWALAFPLLTATGAMLSAGADIYLLTSAVLLLVQRAFVVGLFSRIADAWRHRGLGPEVITLDDAALLANHGNKAYRLAQMRQAGMPVPDGLLLTPKSLDALARSSASARNRVLDRIWQRLGRQHLAVRSSASGEDSAGQSFAGVFESVINVDREGLESAIAKVRGSFEAERVSSYKFYGGTGSVLVQRMVDAEYAGVLFTRDPAAGGLAMVEMVEGTAENLVSGNVRPQTCRFGRVSRKPFGDQRAPIDLTALLALGDQAERLFGCPQDMEWTYRDGSFFLVQSRDITRPVAGDAEASAIQHEYARITDIAKDRSEGASASAVVFGKNELSEMLPRPTPLSLSLMEALWASGGSIDHAAQHLGLSYRVDEDSNYLVTILGRLYIDKREEKRRALAVGPLAMRRLVRSADRIEKDFRDRFLPRFLGETRLQAVADFEKLSTSDLVAEIGRLRDRFVHDTHVEVDAINIAAGIFLESARKALTTAEIDPSSLLGHIPETFEGHAIAEIAATSAKSRRWLLLKNFGHRAVLDYELAEPRYAEDLNTLNRMIAGREQALRPAYRDTPALGKSLAKRVDIARRFQTLKEDAKHHSLLEMAVLRRAVLALDRRYGFDGNLFQLRFDELLTLDADNVIRFRELANRRHELAMVMRKVHSLSSSLSAHDIEAASAGNTTSGANDSGVIRGTRVSGSKMIEGRARVISEEDSEHGSPMEDFRDGDIIVAAMINPAWLPYFSRAGGFVSEVGGWLSHPAILAREYDVAMIVGTEGIASIADGSMVRLHLDGQVEVIADGQAIIAAA
jgi:rhodanese-related sulfurtransferase/membrane protein insertase Oxa1/YidC/SpoIIIJ/phosphohistidine swiveling domain-containing protein